MKQRRAAIALLGIGLWLGACGLDKKLEESLNPPVADKFPKAVVDQTSQTVQVKSTVRMDGSYSWDPQQQSLTYAWVLSDKPNGSSAALSSGSTAVTSFVADKGGRYTATLQVTNSGGNASEVAVVTVDAVGTGSNHPPVAVTTASLTGTVGVPKALDASASHDYDSDAITFSWSLEGAPATSASTVSNSRSSIAYINPDVEGTYQVELTVSDGVDTDTVVVTITVSAAGG